jgi:integrase
MPALKLFNPSDNDARQPASPPAPSPASSSPALTGGAIIRRYLDDLAYRMQTGKVTREHYGNYFRSLSASTSGRYVGFIEIVGERPVTELIQFDLTEWLRRNPQWKKADTRMNNIAAVLGCFHWAEAEGFLKPCPYTKTRQLQEQRAQRRDATDEEADKVWSAASESLRRIIWFVDTAGVRTKEARDLLWEQVDFERSIILIKVHKTLHQTVEPEPRIVGLDADGWAEFRRWYELRRPGATHVFLTPRGRTWTKNNLCQTFERLSAKCGLADDLTPYCFRHRYGTQAILCGATEREAGDGLGHKDSRSTRRYSHTMDKIDHIKGVADKVGAARKTRAAERQLKKDAAEYPLFDDE